MYLLRKSRVTAETNRNNAEKNQGYQMRTDRKAAENKRFTNELERLEIYDDLCSQVADMLEELKNVAEGKLHFLRFILWAAFICP